MPDTATIEVTELAVGDRVRFAHGGDERRWWDVRAADEGFAVLTRQAEFRTKGTLYYTIVDWARGRRGPSNVIGQGWDVEEAGGCDKLLLALNGRLPIGDNGGFHRVEVSGRNNVELGVIAVRRVSA
jgi:hypothetical protein